MTVHGTLEVVSNLYASAVYLGKGAGDDACLCINGVNYWASKNSMRMWQDWEPDEIANDLDVIKAHGFTFLRVCPKAALVEDGLRDVTASEHPFADGLGRRRAGEQLGEGGRGEAEGGRGLARGGELDGRRGGGILEGRLAAPRRQRGHSARPADGALKSAAIWYGDMI